MKLLYTTLGFISLGIGCAGIVVRGLPTTPFVLLAASLFAKSSERWYNWLISNKLFGKFIEQYAKEKGMTLKMKILSITLMWTMITISALTFKSIHMKLFLLVMGIIGTIVMGFVLKTITVKTDS
ncbi:MAG TPA: YbaN family protein [Spirochaetota bacterium]|nr:YbaN family protein [Spirochaetota bacterium]HPS85253.1 YbaN family protein [Spirochaetota bacterium]